jgi:thiaminase
MLETNKIMFEIYREHYSGAYRAVYFTELNDHNRDTEISRALAGDHFYSGFIKEFRKEDAKQAIERILERLNDGEGLTPEEVERALEAFIPAAAER